MEAQKLQFMTQMVRRATKFHRLHNDDVGHRLSQLAFLARISIFFFIVSCGTKPSEEPFHLFGKVYVIDSVAGKEILGDPFYVVLTKDSLFSAYGYWDFSFPYETDLRISDSLSISAFDKVKYSIDPIENGFWLDSSGIRKNLYSILKGDYDSIHTRLKIIETQESLLLGSWRVTLTKTEARDFLSCPLRDSSTLRFTRWKDHKIVQLESNGIELSDTCLRRDFRLDGNSIMVYGIDGFLPFKILRLNRQELVLQDYERILYFARSAEQIGNLHIER